MSSERSVVEVLSGQFPQWVLGAHAYRGDQTVTIAREGVRPVCQVLRDAPAAAFDFLMDLTCVDYLAFGRSLTSAPTMASPSPLPYFMTPKPIRETWQRLPAAPSDVSSAVEPQGAAQAGQAEAGYRFEVVYHFYSLAHNHRLRLKVPLTAGDPSVDSITSLWKAADWFEREVWDMFGIRFIGHPNLKRILMYEPFEGHPLRKDYPITKRQPLIGPVN